MAKKPIKVKKESPKENKTDKFLRIAVPRVDKVIQSLRILGNCSNTSDYEYTSEQIELISDALSKALEITLNKFRHIKKERESFSF